MKGTRVLRKIIGISVIVLGLIAAALATASATVWRQSDTVVASTSVGEGETLLVTDPGVLDMVGDDVTIKASAPDGQPVVLAIGRDIDVDGWVGEDPYVRVTGMTNLSTLSADLVAAPSDEETDEPTDEATDAADEEPIVGPDPSGSDMWVAMTEGEGEATLRWTDQPGRWSLLAAGVGEGAQAPSLELTWPRETTTPWLWPGVIAGAVLVLLGIAVLVFARKRRRPARSRRTARKDGSATKTTSSQAADSSVRDENDGPADASTWSTDNEPVAETAALDAVPWPASQAGWAEQSNEVEATAEAPDSRATAPMAGPGGIAEAAPVALTRRELRERAAQEREARERSAEQDAEIPGIKTRGRRKPRRGEKEPKAPAVSPQPGAVPEPDTSASAADVPPPPVPDAGAPGWPGSATDQSPQSASRNSTADAWRRTWGFSTTDDDTDGGER